MASEVDSIDIFTPQQDLLDRGVLAYEENVPLIGQIAAGFTPPGMAVDLAATAKYGRDAVKDLTAGRGKEGAINLGIAGLSALGAIPLIGDLARGPKSYLRGLVAPKKSQGIADLGVQNPRYEITRHQEDLFSGDPVADANKMFDRAVRIGPEFKQQIDEIADQFDLKTTLPETAYKVDYYTGTPVGTTKKIPRMVEKARDKYAGDVTQLTDPIRTRIVVKTPAEEEAVAKALADKFKVFDKGRDIKPEGFVDRKINLQFTGANGERLIGEVGIITAPMWRASNQGHRMYEDFRALFPKGMPTDPLERQAINKEVLEKGQVLQDNMKKVFQDAKKQIDPSFYDEVKKFAMGGYVSGSSGKSLPITPNLESNAVLDIFKPSTKKSATWLGSASVQSDLPGEMKNPSYPAPTGLTTAGPSSQLKYMRSLDINNSLQKSAKNYNLNNINIFGNNDE